MPRSQPRELYIVTNGSHYWRGRSQRNYAFDDQEQVYKKWVTDPGLAVIYPNEHAAKNAMKAIAREREVREGLYIKTFVLIGSGN